MVSFELDKYFSVFEDTVRLTNVAFRINIIK